MSGNRSNRASSAHSPQGLHRRAAEISSWPLQRSDLGKPRNALSVRGSPTELLARLIHAYVDDPHPEQERVNTVTHDRDRTIYLEFSRFPVNGFRADWLVIVAVIIWRSFHLAS